MVFPRRTTKRIGRDMPLEQITASWCHIQGQLFPWLRAEVGPLTEQHERLVTVLEMARVEAFVPMHDGGPGVRSMTAMRWPGHSSPRRCSI